VEKSAVNFLAFNAICIDFTKNNKEEIMELIISDRQNFWLKDGI
jgi:hypothetical protein